MYKGSQTCASQTSDLKICRATPAGQADPESCENKASDFFHCYHNMVKDSRSNCTDQYASAMGCMKSNISREDGLDDSGVCSQILKDFASCKWNSMKPIFKPLSEKKW